MPPFNRVVDLRRVERIYNSVFPVSYVAYCSSNHGVPGKATVHPTVNFGVIISSNNSTKRISLNGEIVECDCPVAFMELPGATTQTTRRCVDEEFYCSYSAEMLPDFQQLGYVTSSGFWSISLNTRLADLLKHIQSIINAPYKRGNADVMDSYCQVIISEIMVSRTTDRQRQPKEVDNVIQDIYHILNTQYDKPLSLKQIARSHGMSVRTLRRHWDKHYSEPMRLFITKRRISEAQSLMKQGRGNISQIAQLVGYNDPLYFSKKFHEITGMTPSAYIKS